MSATLPVFAPVSRAAAERLAAGGTLDLRAYASEDDEDARYAAQFYAGLAALLHCDGLRLVLAAEVGPDQVRGDPGDEFGAVEVSGLRWGQVQALFADEAGAVEDLGQARALAAGRSLEQVADDDAVLALVEPWDLLWYAPEEISAVPSGPAAGAGGAD